MCIAVVHQKNGTHGRSKLKLLLPTIGVFFTPLMLKNAFGYQDEIRRISSRRFVAPSFNDIRLILNTAQIMGVLAQHESFELITFDGDLTLYNDGACLLPDNPVIPRILRLLSQGVKVAIITAAGYDRSERYYERLGGLLESIKLNVQAEKLVDPTFIVVGGESNYVYKFDMDSSETLLRQVPRATWMLDEMRAWSDTDMQALLDIAEGALRDCISTLSLSAEVLRKERAVGIIPRTEPGTRKFTREQLEETVLVAQQVVEASLPGRRIPFCAFNGGNDVFVDIGDKAWGVRVCQKYLGGIDGSRTLHVGDQFLSAGSNDFKARTACTTAWIANPAETVQLLDELAIHSASRTKR